MIKQLTAILAGVLALLASTGSAQAQTSASPYTSATRYDLMGRVTGTISANSPAQGYTAFMATRTTYDAAGRPIRVESGYLTHWQSEAVPPSSWPIWNGLSGFNILTTVGTTYNAQNAKLSERIKGSDGQYHALTQYSYDTSGRLACTAVRMNPAEYNDLSESACDHDVQGSHGPDRITKNIYDAAGQLVQMREGVGVASDGLTIDANSKGVAEVTYAYTGNGKVRYVIDAGGNRAEKVYDGHDRQLYWVFPSATKPTAFNDSTPDLAVQTAGAVNNSDYEAYGYDANGNRTSLRRRTAETINYEYDALNRMTRKLVPNRAGNWCGLGNATLCNTHTRDVFYSYDLRGLMTSARFDTTGGEGVLLGYDGFGRKTSETLTMDGATRVLGSQYDANGNRTRLTHPDDTAQNPRAFWYHYDGLNRPWSIYLNGTSPMTLDRFDAAGRRDRLYRRNMTGADWYPVTGTAYHPSGRPSSYWNLPGTATHNATVSFTYNPAGQITVRSHDNDSTYAWAGAAAADHDYTANGLNQYSAVEGRSHTYDANGNLTYDGTHTYTYDVENRLIRRAAGTTASLRYDPLGRLYEVIGSDTDTTRFFHDGDALAAEYNGSGTLLRRYVHGTGAGDDPLVWFEGSGVADSARRYLYADERGSIVAVTDASGAVLTVNKYDEYGVPNYALTNDTATHGRFRYTGQAYIPELGMYYYKARMYSPTLGRFMQVDPIGYEDAFNLYIYAHNDPANGTDPTGLDCCYGSDGYHLPELEPLSAEEAAALIGGTIGLIAAIADVVPGDEPVGAAAGAAAGSRVARAITGGADDAAGAARTARTCCFVAGTLVDTEDGLRPIEQVQIGEKVWARDEDTGETSLKEVTELVRRHERVIWQVALAGPDGEAERFETTDDHPWWIAGQGWITTEDLKAGMAAVTRNGRGSVVESVIESDRSDTTYNLTVEDFETYFVGGQRVLVHNCPTGSYTNTHASRTRYHGKGDASRAADTGREQARRNNDPLVKTETRSASNDRESFKQESRALEQDGGPQSNTNYNKIDSPGTKYRREDGEID